MQKESSLDIRSVWIHRPPDQRLNQLKMPAVLHYRYTKCNKTRAVKAIIFFNTLMHCVNLFGACVNKINAH